MPRISGARQLSRSMKHKSGSAGLVVVRVDPGSSSLVQEESQTGLAFSAQALVSYKNSCLKSEAANYS